VTPPLPSSPPDAPDETDAVVLASRLRQGAFRLARLLRQQDDSGLAPAMSSALAVINRDGALTFGELAAQEQVSPPTVTKVVAALEQRSLVERVRDADDRRVWRARITARGRRQVEALRTRRTAWLARQLHDLPPDELDRLAAAIDVIERLAAPRPRSTAP
jgi:DNA-binding MarR family transcriptional regulator